MTNEEIKKEINERIEALKLELESKYTRVTKEPEFEDGVWYKYCDDETYSLYSNGFSKGFFDQEWVKDIQMTFIGSWKKVTDFTELEELLKKEAVKRGMVDGAKSRGYAIAHPLKLLENKQLIDKNGLILMFYNGTWAEVVKEKTTEEWICEVYNGFYTNNINGLSFRDFTNSFCKTNNLKIIQEK